MRIRRKEMAKGPYTYEYNDEHGDYTIRKFEGTNIAYKIYDTYDGEKDTPEKAMKRSIEERKAQGKDVSFLEKRLKDKPETKETKEKETSEKEDNGEPKLEYETNFHLEAPVNDFEAAQAYLSDDDMTQYIPDELKDVVKDVKWELDDEESGHISFKTTRELTAEESKKMSDWIDGQNSDGLGEGFEQQDFAISYYDPYSGDGPYTYDEYQREIENRYDNLEPSEYADYLSDDAIEQGIQSWMEENEVDHIETDEEYERVREEVLDDPESYIDWEDIDTAKNDYMNDNEDLQEDHWFNMSSMKGNKGYGQEQNEFKVSEIEPEERIPSRPDGTPDYSSIEDDYAELVEEYNNSTGQGSMSDDAFIERARQLNMSDEDIAEEVYYKHQGPESNNTSDDNIKRLLAKKAREEAEATGDTQRAEMFANYEKRFEEREASQKNPRQNTRDQLSEKGYNLNEGELINYKDKDGNSKTGTFYGVGPEGEVYMKNSKGDWEVFATDINDVSDRTKASSIAREFLNPDNEYTDAWLQQQAEENGIEIADLDREIGRQMREGGMSYGERKRETAKSAERAQRIIDNDEWYDVTVDQNGTKATLKDQRTGKTVELDPYDSDEVIKSKLNGLRPGTERNVQPIPFENTDDGYYFFDDNPDATDEDFRKAKEEYNKRTGYEEKLNNWYKREYGKSIEEIEAERAKPEEHKVRSSEEIRKERDQWANIHTMTAEENWRTLNDELNQAMKREAEASQTTKTQSIQDKYGLKDKRNEMTVYDYENGDIDEEELTDYLKLGNESQETIDRVISQNKKTTNETMNDKIRETVSNKNARKNFKSDYEYKTAKNEPEWTKVNKKSLEENFKKDTGLDPYFKDGREKTIFQDYQTWSYGKHANDTNQRNKGIKTIAKEYYGEGWNKLSENQKQIWIERNESWLKSAVEAANKKKK